VAACWHGWFDGAARPNPGRLGLGAVLVSPAGERQELSRCAGSVGCNNEAEMLALIALLELAQARGARRIKLHGDSDFAIRAGRRGAGAELTQVPRLVPLITRLQDLLSGFEAVALVWIPRHRNGAADRLARQAIGLPEKIAEVPVARKRRRGQR
jgi:ribonuclease HI